MAKNKQKRQRFSKKFWRDLANKAINLIKTDALNGILQGDKEIDRYINGDGRRYPYSAYKQNHFRRFSDGRSLLRYEGKQIVSTDIDRVNMQATGELLEGIYISKVDARGFEIKYNTNDEMKVVGNEAYGRSVTDLSIENGDIIADKVMEEFGRQIDIFSKDKTVINVGLKL